MNPRIWLGVLCLGLAPAAFGFTVIWWVLRGIDRAIERMNLP